MTTSTRATVLREETFVDAGAWVALFDSREMEHQSAVDTWAELMTLGCQITTTTWTLFEALTILNKANHDLAMDLLNFIREPANQIELIDGCEHEVEALEMFCLHQDKTAGVVDCASFAVIKARECRQAFTYDRRDFGPAAGALGFLLIPVPPTR